MNVHGNRFYSFPFDLFCVDVAGGVSETERMKRPLCEWHTVEGTVEHAEGRTGNEHKQAAQALPAWRRAGLGSFLLVD